MSDKCSENENVGLNRIQPGKIFEAAIAQYIATRYSGKGIKVYREVPIGRTIVGASRRIDIVVLEDATKRALAFECKWQGGSGSIDAKIIYALTDVGSLPMKGYVVYAGTGFSEKFIHELERDSRAVYCLPPKNTKELDQVLALHFGWWENIINNREAVLPGNDCIEALCKQVEYTTKTASSSCPECPPALLTS